jgi:hypothetical protein
METNLPELCRRVWGKVPEAQPFDDIDLLKWNESEELWYIGYGAIRTALAESMIRDAALRWLLDNDGMGFTSHYGKGTGRYFVASENTYPDTTCVWHSTDQDLTTCLLLAVERCQEYKENSK